MDLWTLSVKNTHRSPFSIRNSIPEKHSSRNSRKDVRLFEIRITSRRNGSGFQSLVARAKGKKNHENSDSSSSSSSGNGDQPIPEGDGAKGNNSSSKRNKSKDTASQNRKTLDWREFRATLFSREQVDLDGEGSSFGAVEVWLMLLAVAGVVEEESGDFTPGWARYFLYEIETLTGLKISPSTASRTDSINFYQAETAGTSSPNQDGAGLESKPIGLKWAHPISSPEKGCVLVATEKLDGVHSFERTVVLLLRSGTTYPQEGPFGVIINRPLNKRIRHMKPTNLDLANTFADSSLYFGGPLEASMFLSKTGAKSRRPGFEEVIPGLCFGARNSLDEAAGLVKKGILKPRDFKFFVGYAGWRLHQLRDEIESDYWHVAACSDNLLFGGSANSSSEGLWEEILQLMGGHYSELSRKPKQDL